jgi:hypothetical protein
MQRAGLDGTAILSTTTIESVKSPEQMKQQPSSSDGGGSAPTSVGGAVGGAIGGLMRRRAQQNQQNNPPSARSTFMTINNEVLKIAPNASSADVAIPVGFKERN